MLAIWRVHGIDLLLREAWEEGVVLWGASAGMICWFEHGVTDSFGPQLAAMNCLGLLPGVPVRTTTARSSGVRVIASWSTPGSRPGVAADDGVGLHYVDGELAEVVTCRPGAAAYRVDASGETPLEARLL